MNHPSAPYPLDGDYAVCIYQAARPDMITRRLAADAPAPNGWEICSGSPAHSGDSAFIRQALRRCVPWLAEAWLVPCAINQNGGRKMGGLFTGDRIYVAYSGSSAPWLLATVYHEIYHAAEARLDPRQARYLQSQVHKAGLYWDDPDYLDQGPEKMARFFEFYAMYLEHGGHMVHLAVDEPGLLCAEIYNGVFAETVQAMDAKEARSATRKARLQGALDTVGRWLLS